MSGALASTSRLAIIGALIMALVVPAAAAPSRQAKRPTKHLRATKAPSRGAAARVAFSRAGELKTVSEPVGRRTEPLTLEEDTAKQIAKLLRGPGLRNGTTGLYVAEARTGQPLFAVNADDLLNPASNVKMISTATALELLGPDFRYPTRLLGPEPVRGAVRGDVYLLGSYDPTLRATDLDDIAALVEARGVTTIAGDIVLGVDPTRDGIYRSIVPIEIVAGEPGATPTATVPVGAEHVTTIVTAKTTKRRRARLTFSKKTINDPGQPPRVELTIGGTVRRGRTLTYKMSTRERTTTAAYALRAALQARGIGVTGGVRFVELGNFIGDAVAAGSIPVELGRHDSRRLAEITARVNKWSINWLADRVVMTAAGLARRQPPSMELAIEAMYGWLARHPHLATKGVVIDTGSGLSYRTQISASNLVAVIRSAAGFTADPLDPSLSKAWLDSLAVARHDGTLRRRLHTSNDRVRVRGKTGTLSTVIAMSGVIDVDPDRPLVFSLVTNTDVPLSKRAVRRAHDRVMGTLCEYLAKAERSPANSALTVAAPALALDDDEPDEVEETEVEADDDDLDAETLGR